MNRSVALAIWRERNKRVRRALTIAVGVIVSLLGAVGVGAMVPEVETCTVIQPGPICHTDENGEEVCFGGETSEDCATTRSLGYVVGTLTFAVMLCATIQIADRVSDRQ